VFRLLKDDLANFYEVNRRAEKSICSYYLKTIVLHLWEDEESWTSGWLRRRYVDALRKTATCLQERNIEHYFIPGENLLDEKEISDEEIDVIKGYFVGIIRKFVSCN